METLLQKILSEIESMKAEMVGFKEEQQATKLEMAGFKEEQQATKLEMAGLKEEQQATKLEMAGFKEEQQSMKAEMIGFKNEQQATKLEMREGFASVNKRVDRLEARIESEVIDKIRALFDAREVFNDNLNSFRDEVNSKMEEIVVRDFDKTIKLNKIEKIINLKHVK